jgi:hypothetical protein
MNGAWDPAFLERSPMFEPLRIYGRALTGTRWPALDALQELVAARRPPLTTCRGLPLKIVPQARSARAWEEKHEARTRLRGELQVRSENWHDLFNILVWLTFPRAKAALNERHYRALLEQRAAGAQNRRPLQDALTLFDEGGVIVAARDRALLSLIEKFAWKELFWHNRGRVTADVRVYLFGHALYEKALAPFSGITGRGLLFEIDAEFLAAPLSLQIARLDALLAPLLLDPARLCSTRELAPVPILGVPGWCAGNARESYYDYTDYFRPARKR